MALTSGAIPRRTGHRGFTIVELMITVCLVAILLGTEIAGILGALIAIPVAGSIQVVIGELIQRRDERRRSVVMG